MSESSILTSSGKDNWLKLTDSLEYLENEKKKTNTKKEITHILLKSSFIFDELWDTGTHKNLPAE